MCVWGLGPSRQGRGLLSPFVPRGVSKAHVISHSCSPIFSTLSRLEDHLLLRTGVSRPTGKAHLPLLTPLPPQQPALPSDSLAALKPGACAHHPRHPVADPTVQALASLLVFLALSPLLAPLTGGGRENEKKGLARSVLCAPPPFPPSANLPPTAPHAPPTAAHVPPNQPNYATHP